LRFAQRIFCCGKHSLIQRQWRSIVHLSGFFAIVHSLTRLGEN
jgi:hypothetical protein